MTAAAVPPECWRWSGSLRWAWLTDDQLPPEIQATYVGDHEVEYIEIQDVRNVPLNLAAQNRMRIVIQFQSRPVRIRHVWTLLGQRWKLTETTPCPAKNPACSCWKRQV